MYALRVNCFAPAIHILCYAIPMQQPVKERVAKLREEIAQIRESNRRYLRDGKKSAATEPDHVRRLQRLKEILDELASLTQWKQP